MKPNEQKQLPSPTAGMLVACGAALATLVPVALHQTGVIEHLPDPPGGWFDSDGITESKAAHPFHIPDGLLGIASYSATFALILVARRNGNARKLLAAKLVADGGIASSNAVRQVVKFQKVCSWCTGTGLATAAMLFAARHLLREASCSARRAVAQNEL